MGCCRSTVVIATCALGMGVNIHNIHFVVNFGLPDNLEEFLQQLRPQRILECCILWEYTKSKYKWQEEQVTMGND